MSPAALGALVGLLGGVGLVLVVEHVRARRPTLDRRLAPYLRPLRTESSLLHRPAATSPPSQRTTSPAGASVITPAVSRGRTARRAC